MPKLYLGEAIGLLAKTLPFIWIRLGSYLLLGVGLLVYFGIIGGVAWLLGQLWGPLGFILFLLAIGGAFGIVRWVTRYYFYLLKAAHTAVMTEFIVYGRGPEGGQVDYGRRQVTERFRDTSVMFAVDVLVDGVVKRIVRTFVRVASVLPIPGLDSLGKLLERVALMSSTYVDESILSRAYKERESNVWKVAYDGVVLYAQAWKPIVANAVVLSLISYVEFFLLLIILGLPALAVAAVFPGLGPALGIAVVVGAWMLKLAVADAWSLAATLLAYHRATEGQEPNPEWVAKLEGVSDQFKELGRKAKDAVDGYGAPSGAPSEGASPEGASTGGTTPPGAGEPGGSRATGAAGGAVAGSASAASPAGPEASDGGDPEADADGSEPSVRRRSGTAPGSNASREPGDSTDT